MSDEPKRGKGRPRIITLQILNKIIQLKQENKSWRDIGLSLNVDKSTAAAAYSYWRKDARSKEGK